MKTWIIDTIALAIIGFVVAFAFGFTVARVCGQPAQAPKPPQAPPMIDDAPLEPYKAAWDEAAATGRPLVVYVGTPAKAVAGCVVVSVAELNGSARQRTLKGDVEPGRDSITFTEIGEAIAPPAGRVVSREAAPFAGPDVDDAAQFVPVLAELERYQRATMTQQSFRRWSGYIAPFPRLRQEAKWQIPGGLVGVQGWSSRLYRTRGLRTQAYLTRQDPSDGSSTITWAHTFPVGSVFADVLTNAHGAIFEIRLAEKADDGWQRFVAYKNVAARPHGYAVPSRNACRECHAGAGRSEYGAAEGANPGADTVLSVPLEPVEGGRTVQGGNGLSL